MNDESADQRPHLNTKSVTIVLTIVVSSVVLFGSWLQYRESCAQITRANENLERVQNLGMSKFELFLASQRIHWVLRYCVDAVDVPSLGGKRIVSRWNIDDQLVLYVPDGDHELEIECKRSSANTEIRKRSWRVPLVAESGYVFRVHAKTKDAAPFWEITSNNSEFSERKEAVFTEPFWQSASSQTHHSHFLFPNLTDLTVPVVPKGPEGLVLIDPTFEARDKSGMSKLSVVVRLHSKNPNLSSWRDRWRVAGRTGETRTFVYQGDGAYSVEAGVELD